MSDAAEALAPTLSNFDAIVARNSAKADVSETVSDAPDTLERDDVSEIDPEEVEEVAAEPEESSEDDSGDEGADEEEQSNDPLAQPVEQAMRAPFKAFRQVLKTKQATPEFLEAIGDIERVIQTVNGPVRMKFNEMDGHVMREARFSREMQKTKEDQARAQNLIQIEQQRTNAWRQNPGELRRGLEIMGCAQALDALHMEWARETHSFLSASPEEQRQIMQNKQLQTQRAQEQMRYAQMERELNQLKQQNQQSQFDEPTRNAGDYINKNMDSVLGAALKKANAGRVSDPVRQDFVNELTALAQQGVPLSDAMKEAAGIVADRYAERRELAQAQNRETARTKPEVSGKRAPAGGAPPKRDSEGRFKPPTGKSSNGRSKGGGRTAADFGERFGV